VNIFLLL